MGPNLKNKRRKPSSTSLNLGMFTIKVFAVGIFIGFLLYRLQYDDVHEVSVCPQRHFSKNTTRNCDFATLQGHRQYQEDRVTCNLDMQLQLPFLGESGAPEELSVGIAAIFDGHGGNEASQMASTRLFDYFSSNVVSTVYNHTINSFKSSLGSILEEALLRTIQDIDSEFSKEALDKGCNAGSTATIVLMVDGEFLVANVGDTKALMCSHYSEGALSGKVYAEELTRDHHPDREDEKTRIEAAGGFVRIWGVPRVNGMLAVSRAIGDVSFKRYGVTAEPELSGWRSFTHENSYLIVASDGVFETLTPQDVCELVEDKVYKSLSEHVTTSSLSDLIVHHAFRTGSMDNLSAIVISGLLNRTDGRSCA